MTAKFRYIGAYPEGAESMRCYDVVFTPGAAVTVPDRCVAKARGNRFFEEVTDGPAAKADHCDPLDPTDRLGLIALAENRGVKIDKRWNAEKLAAAIEDAATAANEDAS